MAKDNLFSLVLCLVVFLSLVQPVLASDNSQLAFSFDDVKKFFNIPTSSPAPEVKPPTNPTNLLCKYLKLFCPKESAPGDDKNTPKPPGAQSTPTPNIEQPKSFLNIPIDVIKKLWGNNPPPSWGGVGGKGDLPLPGGSGPPTGGSSSGVISGCTGGLSGCVSACQSNQAACKARYCYCSTGGSGPDCKTIIDLSTKFPTGAASCGGVPSNSGPGTDRGSAGAGEVAACSGGFAECRLFCETNQTVCQSRLKACLNGAFGDDCETFKLGYQECCVKKACSNPSDQGLVIAFCGSSSVDSRGELQRYCEESAENESECKTAESECRDPDNPLVESLCGDIKAKCQLSENNSYCKKRGYI